MKVAVSCWRCGAEVFKESGEVNRARRLGRNLFCSLSCVAQYANGPRQSRTLAMACPTCGVTFETSTHNKAKRHCSRSCASKGSMTEGRRAAQRAAGLEHAKNLMASTAEVLKRREAWKYAPLEEALRDRPHEFEYQLGKYVFDLALFDTNVLVEFDGPYHDWTKQREVDRDKERVAAQHGFTIERRRVQQAAVISPATLSGL